MSCSLVVSTITAAITCLTASFCLLPSPLRCLYPWQNLSTATDLTNFNFNQAPPPVLSSSASRPSPHSLLIRPLTPSSRLSLRFSELCPAANHSKSPRVLAALNPTHFGHLCLVALRWHGAPVCRCITILLPCHSCRPIPLLLVRLLYNHRCEYPIALLKRLHVISKIK